MSIKIALFASGSGSNVENILNFFSKQENIQFPLIISNNPNAFVHERARKMAIPSVNFNGEDFVEGDKILSLLSEYKIDFIVLAGFLLKIPKLLIDAYPNKIINIHPALLPKYGGKGMYGMHVHQAVKAAGERETGITIHYVNEYYDKGNIIFQAKCEIAFEDSPEDIALKVHALEYKHFPEEIARVTLKYNAK